MQAPGGTLPLHIILAALATALPAEADTGLGWFTDACTVLVGMATAIHIALNLDMSLDLIAKQANQFKVLQDRFRQGWRIGALDDLAKFQAEFATRIGQMDALRSSSLPPPGVVPTTPQPRVFCPT